jgi:hypothetical protein
MLSVRHTWVHVSPQHGVRMAGVRGVLGVHEG